MHVLGGGNAAEAGEISASSYRTTTTLASGGWDRRGLMLYVDREVDVGELEELCA